MSKPSNPKITQPARRDLAAIAKETESKWGWEQRVQYLAKLDTRIQTLAYTPKMGVPRDDLGAGRRIVICGKHVIVYRLIDGQPEISRILHGSMDLEREIARGKAKSRQIER